MPQAKGSDSKFLKLRSWLEGFIAKHPAGAKLPSFSELVEAHKVNKVTIERALADLDNAGQIVREYGRGVFISESAKRKSVGVVFGRDIFALSGSCFDQLLLSFLMDLLGKAGMRCGVFVDTPEVEVKEHGIFVSESLRSALAKRSLDGLLISSPKGPKELAWIAGGGIPFAIFAPRPPGCANGVSVHFDLPETTRMGAELLARAGCRKIAALHGFSERESVFSDAFAAALAGFGLNPEPRLLRRSTDHSHDAELPVRPRGMNEEFGAWAVDSLMEGLRPGAGLPFDGLLSLDDMMAKGALLRLRQLGFEAGTDFLTATHANKGSPALDAFEGRVAKMEIDPQEAAKAMLLGLSTLLEKGPGLSGPGVHHVKPRLIEAAPSGTWSETATAKSLKKGARR